MAALKIVSLLLLVSAVYATPFTNCDVGVPVKAVDITDCDAEVCIFVRGQTYTFNVTFAVDHEVTALDPSLIIYTPTNPPADQPVGDDGCPLIVGGCPLSTGVDNVFSITMTVDPTGFLGEFYGEFNLIDQNNGNLACTRISGLVRATPPKFRI